VPRKELEEVPKEQMEDPKHEEAAHNYSKEEQAKRAYHNSHRRKSEGSEWMSIYMSDRSEILAECFQGEQSSSDHVLEVRPREQYRVQQRLRRIHGASS